MAITNVKAIAFKKYRARYQDNYLHKHLPKMITIDFETVQKTLAEEVEYWECLDMI